MTKLMEWIFVLSIFFAAYVAIVTKQIQSGTLDNWMFEIKIAPVLLILLFGAYSAFTVLYRVFTFNDCPEAAEELKKQITEARADLTAKGFKFVEKNLRLQQQRSLHPTELIVLAEHVVLGFAAKKQYKKVSSR